MMADTGLLQQFQIALDSCENAGLTDASRAVSFLGPAAAAAPPAFQPVAPSASFVAATAGPPAPTPLAAVPALAAPAVAQALPGAATAPPAEGTLLVKGPAPASTSGAPAAAPNGSCVVATSSTGSSTLKKLAIILAAVACGIAAFCLRRYLLNRFFPTSTAAMADDGRLATGSAAAGGRRAAVGTGRLQRGRSRPHLVEAVLPEMSGASTAARPLRAKPPPRTSLGVPSSQSGSVTERGAQERTRGSPERTGVPEPRRVDLRQVHFQEPPEAQELLELSEGEQERYPDPEFVPL